MTGLTDGQQFKSQVLIELPSMVLAVTLEKLFALSPFGLLIYVPAFGF
jgi:hypothetical protein